MAYTTGEATNHLNLLEALRDYVVAQGWTQIGGQTGPIAPEDFVSLRAPGLGGTDQIFMSLQAHSNAPAAHYTLRLRGHTAYNPGVPSVAPPGLNSPWTYLPLINSTIRYWIVVNGRRFILVAKSNNRYDVMYGGFMLPEHLPSDWSYPLLIGGSANDFMQNASDSPLHASFWRCAGSSFLFTPQQSWAPLQNISPSPGNNGTETALRDGVLVAVDWKTNYGDANYTRTIDDKPWLRRGRLAQFSSSPLYPSNFLGHFDGVYFTPSAGAVVESLIASGGADHLVVPNVYRNSVGQAAAIRLE